MTDHAQSRLNLPPADDPQPTEVETFRFEHQPIKGYPELRWHGKRPFTSTHYYPAQLKERHGPEVNGWRNKIYWGDNLQVMSHLLKYYRGQVALIYIDPPFDSKAEYNKTVELRGKQAISLHSAFEEKQYSDIWTNDEYLQFMLERFVLLRELLRGNGSIFVHCDWHKIHHLRSILDEIFGPQNFQNEIVWYYYNKMQGNINRFASNHDTLLWYSKGSGPTFNKVRELRDEPIKQIKRVWDAHSQRLVNAKDEDGRVLYITSTHRTVDDVWRISMLQPADKTENLRYPTQKPEALLARVVASASNPGDIVFDCFMGSGTTQAVAMKLGRRFIGADINLGAVQITTKRLIQVAADLKQEKGQAQLSFSEDGDDQPTTFYPGFEVYNVNHYDIFRNPVEARDLLLDALEVHKLPAGHIFDGEKDGRMIKIMPVNRIATREDLNPLITNFDYSAFERRRSDHPTQPVEKLTLVCMGHELDLAAQLKTAAAPYNLDVQVVDILRDRADIQFKRDSEARITTAAGFLTVEAFYPMNLLSKLSLQKEYIEDWRELVESIMIDWNYDGAVLEPAIIDIPAKNELVSGRYPIPADAGTIRIKITDLLSESLEQEIPYA